MAGRELTADQCEDVVRSALRAGDMEGVDAGLRVMAMVDPARALELFDALRVAVSLAGHRLR